MRIIEKLYEQYLKSTGVSTDTRTITSGNIFFALKGPNFNANAFTQQALASGAQTVVIDSKKYAIKGRTILVYDVLQTLQALALFHRQHLNIPVIAITGSNGKTTTKELIFHVLKQKYSVQATEGNLNNHIGVPLTLLNLQKNIEIAIIEMGANRVGEIKTLCEIARPTHGIITNIGKAHIGMFGGMAGIIKGKTELYKHLKDHNGIVFVNQHHDLLLEKSKNIENKYLYPDPDGYYTCSLLKADPFLQVKTAENRIFATRMIGQYNFDNVASALCIGKYFEVAPDDALRAVESYVPDNNRSQIISSNNQTIILDAYNANPTSMTAALENLQTMEGDKKAVILGDMYELGDDSEKEHRSLGKMVAEMSLEKKIFCGKQMRHAKETCPDGLYFENKEDLINHLAKDHLRDYTILIKGSRGMALEDVLPYLH